MNFLVHLFQRLCFKGICYPVWCLFYEVIISSNVSSMGVGVKESQVETKTFNPMSYGNEAFNLYPRCVVADHKFSPDIHLYPEVIWHAPCPQLGWHWQRPSGVRTLTPPRNNQDMEPLPRKLRQCEEEQWGSPSHSGQVGIGRGPERARTPTPSTSPVEL